MVLLSSKKKCLGGSVCPSGWDTDWDARFRISVPGFNSQLWLLIPVCSFCGP